MVLVLQDIVFLMLMERRDFLLHSGMLAAFGLTTTHVLAEAPDDRKLLQPFLLPAQEPLQHNGGLQIRTLVRSAMTGGVYSNVETAVGPKLMGPPPHYHKELDELMLVLEGTASVLVGDEVVRVTAGSWHMRPRMIKHTFWNAEDTGLRFIDMYFNQPFEEYLEKIFFELNDAHGYPEGSEKKNQALAALNEQFGLVFPADAFAQYEAIKNEYGLK